MSLIIHLIGNRRAEKAGLPRQQSGRSDYLAHRQVMHRRTRRAFIHQNVIHIAVVGAGRGFRSLDGNEVAGTRVLGERNLLGGIRG